MGNIGTFQFRELARIMRKYSGGNGRTNQNQNLILRNVRPESLQGLHRELKAIGLGEPDALASCYRRSLEVADELDALVAAAALSICTLGIPSCGLNPITLTTGAVWSRYARTMEAIAEPVVAQNLATEEEVADLVARLDDFAATPGGFATLPRIVQVSARAPAR